jgi:hypothetical protein
MNICIPCQFKKALDNERREFLIKLAKQKAIEKDCDYCLYYDSEDSKYMIGLLTEIELKNESTQIIDIVTPY